MMISVILPVYNEEKSIASVIDDVTSVMAKSGYDYEIIVVDDASQDQSVRIGNSKGVRMLGHTIHRGVGVSRKTGILHARGDVIVMLDADGTYSADDIPRLLRFIPEYDQVIGVRSKEYGKLKFVRKAVKSVLFSLASFLSQHKILDLNSGLRVFKKDIMMRYLHLIPDGFSCVSTMTLVFLYHNHSIKFTPIAYHSRIGKSKFNIVRDTLGMTLVILCLTIKFRKSARLAR